MKLAFVLTASFLVSVPSFAAKGFSTNEASAFAEAAKSKKPMLIDFYGIWCPPCNELDETVFETEGFMTKAKQFVLLKVDADAKGSWKIKDRYKVGGYPTLIFTNSKGDEIYRVVGYRNLKEMLRIMDLVQKSKATDFKTACASSDLPSLMRCAITCAERKEDKCANDAFAKIQAKVTKGSAEYQVATQYALESEKSADVKRNTYEKLLLESPDVPYSLVWAAEYLGTFEGMKPDLKPKTELVELVLKNFPKISVSPTMDAVGLSRTDLAQARADLLAKLGRSEEAKTAWKDAANLFDAAAKEMPKGAVARGFTLERIWCLEQAGELDAALALAEEYAKKFPAEFTFHYWQASLLNRAKRYLDATPTAYRAYDVAYGDNKIRAATLLIDILGTIPDKDTVKKVYDAVKGETKPDAKLDVRTHRYLKKLEDSYKKAMG